MIRELCYELYKVDWKHSHMITAQIEMDNLVDYYKCVSDGNFEKYTYNDYLEDFGYQGQIYVCYDEFLDTEYCDVDYMRTLLDDDELINLYHEDLEMLE